MNNKSNNFTKDNLCLIYMSTKGRIGGRVMFLMPRDHAMIFCSLKETKGNGWMFCFTSIETFLNVHNLYPEESRHANNAGKPKIDARKIKDDGRFDDKIKELNLHKIEVDEFKKYLEPLGIEIIR